MGVENITFLLAESLVIRSNVPDFWHSLGKSNLKCPLISKKAPYRMTPLV